jgi:methionyl-tRNA formyltransferase
MLRDIGMLGADTARTHAYLRALRDHDLLPSELVFLNRPGAASQRGIVELARSAGVHVTLVDADDINDEAVVKVIERLAQRYFIFSSLPGSIVRKRLFATGKQLIHVHPGRLPDFRGSTTIYYSLIAERKIEATALLLNEKIDAGPIIGRASFRVPADRRMIDGEFDPDIRASLLTTVMRDYAERGDFNAVEQSVAVGDTYFIIHPVLKHLAILAT